MPNLPDSLFLDPVWAALQTSHRSLALTAGDACRYPADVAPFAALAEPTSKALGDLATLLAPADPVWIFGLGQSLGQSLGQGLGEADPAAVGLTLKATLDCLQMVLPDHIDPPEPGPGILPLTCAAAPEMVALTDIAFPGFFRPRTCAMGSYFGIRREGELIAMGGERLVFPGYSEMSGLCTHPSHRGNSYATSLLWHLARRHRRAGIVSWLHVGASNQRAVDLYLYLGFEIVRKLPIFQLARAA